MLMGIPSVISSQLIRILMEMGHGDELVIADANFPAHTIAKETTTQEVVLCPGVGVPVLLDAILKLMPLDYAVTQPVTCMAVPAGQPTPPIHGRYTEILAAHGYSVEKMEFLPRFDFYDRARKSYAIVLTGETARFANVIIKKGVVTDPV